MATEKLWCQTGNHYWNRETKRGRKPQVCPDHTEVGPALAPVKQPKPLPLEERLVLAREVKAQKKIEREREALKERRDELKKLRAALPKLNSEYNKWMQRGKSATTTEKIAEAFDKADQLQSQIIGTTNAIKRLEREV